MSVLQVDARDWLELDELCRLLAAPPEWVVERVEAGFVSTAGEAGGGALAWRFDAPAVKRLRSMRRTERCYDAGPELAALVADLEQEVARLRSRLRALEALGR